MRLTLHQQIHYRVIRLFILPMFLFLYLLKGIQSKIHAQRVVDFSIDHCTLRSTTHAGNGSIITTANIIVQKTIT